MMKTNDNAMKLRFYLMRSFLLLIHLVLYSSYFSAQNYSTVSYAVKNKENLTSHKNSKYCSSGSTKVYIKPGTVIVGHFNVSQKNIPSKEKQKKQSKKTVSSIYRQKRKFKKQYDKPALIVNNSFFSSLIIRKSRHLFLNRTSKHHAVIIPASFLYKCILPCNIFLKIHYLISDKEKKIIYRSYRFFSNVCKYSSSQRGPPYSNT
nr:hypothetical protein [uncultured Chryseobacterium sp.]